MADRKIKILDTTLRDGEQAPGYSMNLYEKLEMASQLERLGVDIIEAGFASASPEDFEAVRSVAEQVKTCTVTSLSRALKADIDKTFDAVRVSMRPRIHIVLATSDLHMRYKLGMSPEEVLERARESVRYAKRLCDDVEFSAEDATRSDRDFLEKVLETVIEEGANTVSIPDTVGYRMPQEMAELVTFVKEHVKGIEKACISVHCHDDLGFATANTLAGIRAGAGQAECTINGIGERAGNASLEEVTMGLYVRPDYYHAYCPVNLKQIYRTSKLLTTITGVTVPPNKSHLGANGFAQEAGNQQHGILANRATYEIMSPEVIGVPQNRMVLGKHSGKHAFADRLSILGYELSEAQLEKAFASFKQIADRKKTVTDRDLEALIGNQHTHFEPTYLLKSFVVNSGTVISATAAVKLIRDDEVYETVSTGDGPIDAAFKAIEMTARSGAVLDNYTINSVTEGEDALGEVIVKLKAGGTTVTGRGLSTDIIEASIKAYLNGVNKIVAPTKS